MYAYLKGTLEEIAEDAVVVEVGNIGYNVRANFRIFNKDAA